MAPPNNIVINDEQPKFNANEKLMDWEAPKAQGLYDPQNEHEACGVGFIVAIDGQRNHKVSDLFIDGRRLIRLKMICFIVSFQYRLFSSKGGKSFRILLSY